MRLSPVYVLSLWGCVEAAPLPPLTETSSTACENDAAALRAVSGASVQETALVLAEISALVGRFPGAARGEAPRSLEELRDAIARARAILSPDAPTLADAIADVARALGDDPLLVRLAHMPPPADECPPPPIDVCPPLQVCAATDAQVLAVTEASGLSMDDTATAIFALGETTGVVGTLQDIDAYVSATLSDINSAAAVLGGSGTITERAATLSEALADTTDDAITKVADVQLTLGGSGTTKARASSLVSDVSATLASADLESLTDLQSNIMSLRACSDTNTLWQARYSLCPGGYSDAWCAPEGGGQLEWMGGLNNILRYASVSYDGSGGIDLVVFGGSHVGIPNGTYKISPLTLMSGISANATFVASNGSVSITYINRSGAAIFSASRMLELAQRSLPPYWVRCSSLGPKYGKLQAAIGESTGADAENAVRALEEASGVTSIAAVNQQLSQLAACAGVDFQTLESDLCSGALPLSCPRDSARPTALTLLGVRAGTLLDIVADTDVIHAQWSGPTPSAGGYDMSVASAFPIYPGASLPPLTNGSESLVFVNTSDVALSDIGELVALLQQVFLERPVARSTCAVAPAITGVFPTLGPASGGTSVAITGMGFSAVTGVSFGGVVTTDFVIIDDRNLTVQTPEGGAGEVDVSVTTGDGSSPIVRAGKFTYE